MSRSKGQGPGRFGQSSAENDGYLNGIDGEICEECKHEGRKKPVEKGHSVRVESEGT